MANGRNGTLYAGVTNDLIRRIAEHREKVADGFTAKYGCDRLVWFEPHESIEFAIRREKLLKRWHREWKLNLIERENPDWSDLSRHLRP
jgi:putative endonuclease